MSTQVVPGHTRICKQYHQPSTLMLISHSHTPYSLKCNAVKLLRSSAGDDIKRTSRDVLQLSLQLVMLSGSLSPIQCNLIRNVLYCNVRYCNVMKCNVFYCNQLDD